jgi:hypothetical protein
VQPSIRKVSFLVGLPLAAIALALFVMSLGNGATKVHAAVDPNINYGISTTGCNSDGVSVCSVPAGSTFTVSFNLTTIPAGGYDGYDLVVAWSGTGINYLIGSLVQPQPVGTGCIAPASAGSTTTCFYHDIALGESIAGGTPKTGATEQNGPATMTTGGAQSIHNGSARPSSTYTGSILTFQMVCKSSAGATGTITVKSGVSGGTDIVQGVTPHSEAADESLTVNCVPGPTATPVPPTATPPAVPRVQKTCTSTNNATPSALCNVFLTRQGAKIPPPTCEQGTNVATLTEGLSGPITTQDPKGLTGFQQLGAFEFEVRFDVKSVCVSIVAGPDFTSANGAFCQTVTAKGIVRFGCVTTKKGHNLNPAHPLAVISVRPQPQMVNQLRPNQDNGIPVQITNQGCQLSDEQGHSIPIFSCESADITFRFLEGDINPDCVVNVSDAQLMAFRWGAAKGNLLFTPFMDLSPSGRIKGDGVIDINDLQFVFGRLNSTCAHPWPLQPPVNPKA